MYFLSYLLLFNLIKWLTFILAVEQQIKELQAQRHLLEPRLEFTKNLPGGTKVTIL